MSQHIDKNGNIALDQTRPRHLRFITYVFWYSFIYSGIICFVYFIYTEPESSIPATHNSAEEESADELHAGQAKLRGQGGKSDAGWVQKYQESASDAEVNIRVRDKLHKIPNQNQIHRPECSIQA